MVTLAAVPSVDYSMMTDKMDAASTLREVDVHQIQTGKRNTNLEMLELEGIKGLVVACGDPGSSSNTVDANENSLVTSPEIRDERPSVLDGRSDSPLKEMSDNMVLRVFGGSSDALIAPEGGKYSGVLSSVTNCFTSASLGRDGVMSEPEAGDGLMGLPEVNGGLDVACAHSDPLMGLPEVNSGLDVVSEHIDHLMVQPEVTDGLDVTSEHSDHLMVQPEGIDLMVLTAVNGLDVASEHSNHLMVQPEVTDGSDVASEHSDHLMVRPEGNDLMVLAEVNNGLDVASEHSDHLMVQPEVKDGLDAASEHSSQLIVLPAVKDALDVASEHCDHLVGFPEVNNGLDLVSEHSDQLMALPKVKDGLNDASKHSDDLLITPAVRDALESTSEGSVDEKIAPEAGKSLTMSPKGSDGVLDTTLVKDGVTSAPRGIDEGLMASVRGLGSMNIDNTSIDNSREIVDGKLDLFDVPENVKQECNVCGFCGLSLGSKVDLVKHQKTHFMNNESETSTNASPSLDRPSKEEHSKCSICGEVFSDQNKLSAHKTIHSVDVIKCKVCGKAFRTVDDLQHHKQMHSVERRFICDVCSEAFNTRSSLLNHQTTRHPCNGQQSSEEVNQETRHFCRHCKEAFPCLQDLLEHKSVHVDTKPFICGKCDEVFTSGLSLRRHLATHLNNKNFPCTRCGMSFKSYYHLNRHRQVHKDRPFYCDVCRKMFKTKETLRKHSRHHKEEFLICEKCNKKFKTKVELNRHKRSHKTVEKHYDCDLCNKSYRRAAQLKKHKLSHKGTTKKKPHSCRFCQKSYSKVTQLNLHLQTHAKVKQRTISSRSNRYYCGICSCSFKTYYSMKKHKQMHKERPYMCEICEETFLVGAELRRHKLGKCSNDVICDICNESFNTQHQLQRHGIKHISVKPYMCSFCHKCYKTTKQLKSHMLLHTGSKPHICLVCNKRFAEIENLTRHKKICSIGLKSRLLSKTTERALDPPGIKQEEKPLPQHLPCTADQSVSETSSRVCGVNANEGDISAGEDYKTSDQKAISVNAGLAGCVDVANSDQGSAMHVEMSCTEIFDYPQQVPADGQSSQESDTPKDAKSSSQEDSLINGHKSKKLRLRLEKFVLYICDICDRSFASQDLLDQHAVNHIKEEPQGDQLPQTSLQHPDQHQQQESSKVSPVKKKHPIKPRKPEACASFRCEECGMGFPNGLRLKLHMKASHSKEVRHPCQDCGKTYKHRHHLKEHWKFSKTCKGSVVGAAKTLRCDICGEKFSLIEKYKDHITVHLDERPVKCDTCGKRYKHRAGLEYHKTFLCTTTNDPTGAAGEFVQPSVLNCEVCHKHFSDMPRFKDHIRSHSDARPFSCKICGKSYKYARDVTTHLSKVCRRKIRGTPKGKQKPKENRPNNERGSLKQVFSPPKWKCNLCAKEFRTLELCKSHRIDCRPYKCDKCGKEFSRKIDMIQKHDCISKPLAKGVQVECEVCGNGFKRMTSPGTEHVTMKCKSCSSHKEDVCEETAGEKRAVKPRKAVQGPSGANNAAFTGSEEAHSKSTTIPKFPCKFCNHIFAYKAQLKKHERQHAEERPFKCNKCDRDFTLLQTLQLHKRKSHAISHGRNTGRKKLKCRFCYKFFRFAYERERHENCHFPEKRYKCECGKAFKQKYQLSGHRNSANHPTVQPGLAAPQNSKSSQAAEKSKSSGKPTRSMKDSKQSIPVEGIHSPQTQPRKPEPMCSDENDKGSYRCNKCGEKFSLKSVHEQHEQKCTTLKCRICSIVFNNLMSRETHEKSHSGRGDTKLYKCICGSSYLNKTTLRRHQAQKHPTQKPSELDQNRVEQSETSAPSTSATADKRQLPILPFHCKKCNKGFMHPYELRRHMKTKKWKNGCDQVFKDAPKGKEVGGHLKTTVHQPGPSQQPQRVQQAVEKNVVRVPSGKHLVIHQKSQQKNASRYGVIVVQQAGTQQSVRLDAQDNRLSLESLRKYQQFVESTSFQQREHERTKCCYCSKEYHNPENLARHEKTHSQEVYRCDCGKFFKHKHELKSHQITGHIVNSAARKQHSSGLAEGVTPARMKSVAAPLLRANGFGKSGSPTNQEVFAENGPTTPRGFNEIFKCEVCSHVWYMKWKSESDRKNDRQGRACPSCGSAFSYKFHVKVSKTNISQPKSIFRASEESHQSKGSTEDLPPLRSKDAFHVRSFQRSPVADVPSVNHGKLHPTVFINSENWEESTNQNLTIGDNSHTNLSEVTDLPGGSTYFIEGSKVSSTQSNFVDLQEVPGPEKIRACRFCGKFFMKTYILEHEQSHSEDVHLNMADPDWESLNEDRVIRGLHRSDACNSDMEKADITKKKQSPYINEPYHCEKCGQRLENEDQLMIHASGFCTERIQEANPAATRKSPEAGLCLLKCGVCATFFNSMPLLVDHMKGHD